jgi:Fe-S-cluster-containing hydrogenase component 2
MEKNGAFNPTKSRIRVVRIYPNTNAALNCRMCEDPACVGACPRDALKQSEETGAILVDENLCNGCGWCVQSCEFGAIIIDSTATARMCDKCSDRENGPACVEWCPEEALTLTTTDLISQKTRIEAVKEMANTES